MNTPLLAKESDLEDCYLIIVECSKWLANQGMTHWQDYYNKDKVLTKIHSPDFDVYMFKSENGDPIATITLGIKPPKYYTVNDERVNHMDNFSKPGEKAIYITSLGVRPSYQGKGYAKSLISFAESYAEEKKVSYIRFDARGDYTKLVGFYEKLGYQIVGEMPDVASPYYLFEKKITYPV